MCPGTNTFHFLLMFMHVWLVWFITIFTCINVLCRFNDVLDEGGINDVLDIDRFNDIVCIGGFNDLFGIGGFNEVLDIGRFNDVSSIGGFNDFFGIGWFNDVFDIGGFNDVLFFIPKFRGLVISSKCKSGPKQSLATLH